MQGLPGDTGDAGEDGIPGKMVISMVSITHTHSVTLIKQTCSVYCLTRGRFDPCLNEMSKTEWKRTE